MCEALIYNGGLAYPCPQQSKGTLCYYHDKMQRLLIAPTAGVEQVVTKTGEEVYGETAKRHWQLVSLGRNERA